MRRWEATCEWINSQVGSKMYAFAKAASEMSAVEGKIISASSAKSKYYAWKESGKSWLALADMRLASTKPSSARTKSPRFVSYLAGLSAQNQRCSSSVFRELVRRWKAREIIPGYEDFPNWPSIPSGWSKQNLYRLLPSERELKMMRHGVKASAHLLPQVYGTRAGLQAGSVYICDDVWIDRLCIAEGQIVRPLQFGANDLLTGKRLCWGTKPRLKREDGSHMGLNGDEMLLLLADLFGNVGYTPAGTMLVLENGTASINQEIEEILTRISYGAIKVHRSGMEGGRQVLLRGFKGRAGGNPRGAKGSLESWHNLLHNELASTVGGTGKDRQPPEILHGIAEEERAILKKEAQYGISLAHHLPTFGELCTQLIGIVAQINARTDHNLEGWEACGYTKSEYRLDPTSDAWADLAALQHNNPNALVMIQQMQEMCKGSATLLRQRYLSPSEAWEKQLATQSPLIKFTAGEICELLAPKFARKLAIKGAQIHVKDKALYGSESLIYEARVATPSGYERELDPRMSYQGIVNPHDTSKCYILDERGIVQGVAQQIGRVSYSDLEGLRKASGRAQHRRAEIMAPIRVAAAKIEDDAMKVRHQNDQLIAELNPSQPILKPIRNTPSASLDELY